MRRANSAFLGLWRSLLGGILFYTICPIPHHWHPNFHRIARWCPLIGLMLGGILSVVFLGLSFLNTPNLIKSAVVVSLWLGCTGGLHLDGAMDSADGLAVTDPERRLEVMSDSATGAFGAMAAIIILVLKFAAIASLASNQWWLLLLTPAWGRWSQVMAIALYPYLKTHGKGAFHKQHFHMQTDLVTATLPTLSCVGILIAQAPNNSPAFFYHTAIAMTTSLTTALWLNTKFQGHTGDTYGAAVEWTESILINLGIIILHSSIG